MVATWAGQGRTTPRSRDCQRAFGKPWVWRAASGRRAPSGVWPTRSVLARVDGSVDEARTPRGCAGVEQQPLAGKKLGRSSRPVRCHPHDEARQEGRQVLGLGLDDLSHLRPARSSPETLAASSTSGRRSCPRSRQALTTGRQQLQVVPSASGPIGGAGRGAAGTPSGRDRPRRRVELLRVWRRSSATAPAARHCPRLQGPPPVGEHDLLPRSRHPSLQKLRTRRRRPLGSA